MDGHIAKPVTLPALREELERRIAPVIDDGLLDELAESLGGRALVNQMLQVYRDSLPERLENLRAADDPETLRETAHALRSPSAGFGIARLAARLQVVEAAARAGRMAELGAALVAAAHADRALAAGCARLGCAGERGREPAPQQHRQVGRGRGVGQHRVVVAAAAEPFDRAEAVPAERGAVGDEAVRGLDDGQRRAGRRVAGGQAVVAQDAGGVLLEAALDRRGSGVARAARRPRSPPRGCRRA